MLGLLRGRFLAACLEEEFSSKPWTNWTSCHERPLPHNNNWPWDENGTLPASGVWHDPRDVPLWIPKASESKTKLPDSERLGGHAGDNYCLQGTFDQYVWNNLADDHNDFFTFGRVQYQGYHAKRNRHLISQSARPEHTNNRNRPH
jgi:hypothetical protein